MTRYKHIENTHNSAGQSRGQGRVHALRLRLAACLHPRALRASTPGSSARGRAQRQRTSRFLGADSHSKVRDLLQTGASSVCVCAIRYACAIIRYACASSDMHVTSSDMHVPSAVSARTSASSPHSRSGSLVSLSLTHTRTQIPRVLLSRI